MIEIGEFTIHDKYSHGGLWIANKDGEGMQVTGDTLEELLELIADFWKRHF